MMRKRLSRRTIIWFLFITSGLTLFIFAVSSRENGIITKIKSNQHPVFQEPQTVPNQFAASQPVLNQFESHPPVLNQLEAHQPVLNQFEARQPDLNQSKLINPEIYEVVPSKASYTTSLRAAFQSSLEVADNNTFNKTHPNGVDIEYQYKLVKDLEGVLLKFLADSKFKGSLSQLLGLFQALYGINELGSKVFATNVADMLVKDKNLLSSVASQNSLQDTEVIPDARVYSVNCVKLMDGSIGEQHHARTVHDTYHRAKLRKRHFVDFTRDCEVFRSNRRYMMTAASVEEKEFPIAFSLLVYKDIEQFERLLRAIYRPHNYYCIHVDLKSDNGTRDSVHAIAKCLPNVFMTSQSYDVRWGEYSVIEPELQCMEELIRHKLWKYLINLTGQEFPLRTNWEIVRILKAFSGANNLEGTIARRKAVDVNRRNLKPPIPVTLTKGSVHMTATRGFIEYILFNNNSLLFRDWVKDTFVPDETYFSSLNHSPQLGVPGSYRGIPETDTQKNLFITRFKNWGDGPFNWPCGGKRVRQVCVFGIKDLPLLSTRPELFANKFHLDYEPLTLDCMEELYYDKIQRELVNQQPFINISFYSSLDFVNNHL